MIKEIQKQEFSKDKVNTWVSMLIDVPGNDVETVRSKLILKAQDCFIWNAEVENYISETINKLHKYN